jgi:hypothetical protein
MVFSPGATDVDRRFLALGEQGIGATIMGRNMFGPVRGPWSGTEERTRFRWPAARRSTS